MRQTVHVFGTESRAPRTQTRKRTEMKPTRTPNTANENARTGMGEDIQGGAEETRKRERESKRKGMRVQKSSAFVWSRNGYTAPGDD
ncbi:hypothetical protein PTI98_009340 [Pleurotus ostreatus]|nr:hypothetical protein PTI98_009340 [Pleurotus ostreatus]